MTPARRRSPTARRPAAGNATNPARESPTGPRPAAAHAAKPASEPASVSAATVGEGRIVVHVTPRGGQDAVEGVGPQGELLVRVRAAPVEGGANRAVLRLLADALGVPVTSLVLEAGEGSRTKRFRVPSEAVTRLRAAWPAALVSTVPTTRRSR